MTGKVVFMEEKLIKCSVEVPAGLLILFSHLPGIEPLCTSVMDVTVCGYWQMKTSHACDSWV